MSRIRYSATFQHPGGGQFTLTRVSRQDYGYAVAWCVMEHGVIRSKGFSRTRENAESAARAVSKFGQDRIALFAPVTKGGAA
jgi:hypothetical protein